MQKTVILIAMLFYAIQSGYASEPPAGANVYATRLQSINIPHSLQEKSAKEIGAALSGTYVYVVIVSDGTPVWVSPKQRVIRNQTRFEWPATQASNAALLWEKGNKISMRVFLSDNKLEATVSGAGIGAAGGAGAGALIGGIAAGVFTGGLGAPAGALIGAAIGGGAGATAGVATGALSANDRIVFELECLNHADFPLNGKFEYDAVELGEKHTASVEFRLLEAKTPATQGSLSLGEKYIVRIRNIHLTEAAALKGGKKIDKAKYYIVLQQGEEKYPFHKDNPLALTTGIDVNTSTITVLKNTGQATKTHIYKKNLLFDDLVFSSTIGKIDGRSWVFIGTASSDDVSDGSYVVLETFGPLK